MISNERQYNVTKGQIAKLRSALEVAEDTSKDTMDRRVYEAMVAGIQSQIEELTEQLREYERIAGAKQLQMQSASELPELLIQGRIARGLTQEGLAKKLNLKPQQIQRYEATSYRSASLKRVLEVMRALGLDFKVNVPLDSRA
jgi:ribosome-binding protein aMBF1 (putative translation factor)